MSGTIFIVVVVGIIITLKFGVKRAEQCDVCKGTYVGCINCEGTGVVYK